MWTKVRVHTCGTEFLSPCTVRMRSEVRMRRHKSCIFIAQMTWIACVTLKKRFKTFFSVREVTFDIPWLSIAYGFRLDRPPSWIWKRQVLVCLCFRVWNINQIAKGCPGVSVTWLSTQTLSKRKSECFTTRLRTREVRVRCLRFPGKSIIRNHMRL